MCVDVKVKVKSHFPTAIGDMARVIIMTFDLFFNMKTSLQN